MAASIGDEAALNIYKQLLDITRDIVTPLKNVTRLLFYSDTISRDDSWPNIIFEKHLQSEGDLGDRMEKAFITALAMSDKALIIGSDCPYISEEIIETAFQHLDSHDVVIGPTFDGGYYMLGMKKLHKGLFMEMPWSTDKVYPLTERHIAELKLTKWDAPILHDIDYAEDWEAYLQSK